MTMIISTAGTAGKYSIPHITFSATSVLVTLLIMRITTTSAQHKRDQRIILAMTMMTMMMIFVLIMMTLIAGTLLGMVCHPQKRPEGVEMEVFQTWCRQNHCDDDGGDDDDDDDNGGDDGEGGGGGDGGGSISDNDNPGGRLRQKEIKTVIDSH